MHEMNFITTILHINLADCAMGSFATRVDAQDYTYSQDKRLVWVELKHLGVRICIKMNQEMIKFITLSVRRLRLPCEVIPQTRLISQIALLIDQYSLRS